MVSLLQWLQVFWVSSSVNLNTYNVLLTHRDCNSCEKRITDCLCQTPTSNHSPGLHSPMKPPGHYQRGDLLVPYLSTGYEDQRRETWWKKVTILAWSLAQRQAGVVLGSKHWDQFNKLKTRLVFGIEFPNLNYTCTVKMVTSVNAAFLLSPSKY